MLVTGVQDRGYWSQEATDPGWSTTVLRISSYLTYEGSARVLYRSTRIIIHIWAGWTYGVHILILVWGHCVCTFPSHLGATGTNMWVKRYQDLLKLAGQGPQTIQIRYWFAISYASSTAPAMECPLPFFCASRYKLLHDLLRTSSTDNTLPATNVSVSPMHLQY